MKAPAILLADGSWGGLDGAIIFDYDKIEDAPLMESEDIIDLVQSLPREVSEDGLTWTALHYEPEDER